MSGKARRVGGAGEADGRRPVVLHLFPGMRPGGMERQALRLVRSLAEAGEFHVLAAGLGGPGPVLDELATLGLTEVPLYRLRGMARASTAVQATRFAAHLRSAGVDIVHTHDFYTNTFGVAAATLARVGVRVASRRELDVFTPRQRQVERWFCRRASVVAANCAFLREQLVREGTPPERAVVVPNAVAVEEAPGADPAGARLEVRRQLGLPEFAPLVVMVANLHNTKKDFGTAWRSMELVAARHAGATLVVVGAGAVPAELETAVARGLVRTAGLQTPVTPWLRAADVCLLSSRSEGLSTAVMEYMAVGRPVVATDVGGLRELVEHGRTGLLVPPSDVASMAEAIALLLGDVARAASLACAGRALVQARYSPAQQLAAVTALYRRLLGGTRAEDA